MVFIMNARPKFCVLRRIKSALSVSIHTHRQNLKVSKATIVILSIRSVKNPAMIAVVVSAGRSAREHPQKEHKPTFTPALRSSTELCDIWSGETVCRGVWFWFSDGNWKCLCVVWVTLDVWLMITSPSERQREPQRQTGSPCACLCGNRNERSQREINMHLATVQKNMIASKTDTLSL